MNKVFLLGNVGKDPEVKSLDNGNKIASFTLATSESWKDKDSGERKSKTTWHRVVVFNSALAGVVGSYVKVGSKVLVEGSIANRTYTDKDGVERSISEVVVKVFGGSLTMLGGKDTQGASDTVDDDSIPF